MSYAQEFEDKLAKAHIHEQKIADWLNKASNKNQYIRVEGKELLWDLVCQNTGKTIECKTDYLIANTNNMFIELKGLWLCEAKGFVYENANTNQNYFFNWQDLKDWCRELVIKGDARIVLGGDRNESQGVLIDIDQCRHLNPVVKVIE